MFFHFLLLELLDILQVIISLNALRARLHNAREERDQFDEASNQIIVHLKSKVLQNLMLPQVNTLVKNGFLLLLIACFRLFELSIAICFLFVIHRKMSCRDPLIHVEQKLMLSILGLVFWKIPGFSRHRTQRKRRSRSSMQI